MKLLLLTSAIAITAAAQTLPTVTLTGVPANSGFEQQLALNLNVSAAYSAPITGTITLAFAPSVTPPVGSTGTIDDLTIKFSNGSRTINFTIPAGSTTPTLNNASSITVLTGTTAGSITLTTALTANGAALGTPSTQTIVDKPNVPVVTAVTLQQVAGGITVTVTGYSPTRDMYNGQFAFVPGKGDSFLNNTTNGVVNVSVAVNNAFITWYADTAAANPYGSAFTLTVSFTTTNSAGDYISQTVAAGVTVTLSNSLGGSNPVSNSQ
jgi:hypothetical protein